VELERFPDGETGVQILENVRGRDTFVFQTVALDPNNYLMELLIMIDALKRASARSIVAVIPILGIAAKTAKTSPECRSRPSWWLICWLMQERRAS
jgi:ribose-phosphate pyrophosphokinase